VLAEKLADDGYALGDGVESELVHFVVRAHQAGEHPAAAIAHVAGRRRESSRRSGRRRRQPL